MENTSPLVITISRQLGSGGAHIGQRLAKKLNILYADREIISEAAKRLSVLEEDLLSREEKTHTFWESFFLSFSNVSSAYMPVLYTPPQIFAPTDQELYETETEIIRHIAKSRSAVIIGRCSTHIFCNHPNHVSIFLHAGMAFRKSRLQELYRMSEKDAVRMIIQSDKDRALYYQTFTGKDWADLRQYHLSLDTGKIGLEKSESLILNFLEHRPTEIK